MADQGNNSSNEQVAQEIRTQLPLPELNRSLVQRMRRMPREVFDEVLQHLTIPEQAKLALSNDNMYTHVHPAMDGFVWDTVPLPLPQMMQIDKLQWEYVKQAEAAAVGTGLVACPWCSIIHDPLHSLDKSNVGFPCASQVHIGFDPHIFVNCCGLDNRPLNWHPLVLYAFAIWSQRGRDTTRLVDAAELNNSIEVLEHEEHVPYSLYQWKLKWVPGHGLFARWRQSQVATTDDEWEHGYDVEECCACGEVRRTFDTAKLDQGTFDLNSSRLTRFWKDDNGTDHVTNIQMLEGPYRPLMTSPIVGCHKCSMDFQIAWQEYDTGEMHGMAHWHHFTTWIHVGKDVDIKAIHDVMQARNGHWDDFPQSGPADCSPLGIGQVARLSGFPDDY